MRNWSGLLPEMLSIICNRVVSSKDLAAFGGVCYAWRSAALEHNKGFPLSPSPLLMLPENQNNDIREFYSVSKRKTYSLELPELRGKKCMETKGWIVTVSNQGEMALVNPLTRVQIQLPHLNTFRSCYDYQFWTDPLILVEKAVLSSSPDPNNERDCVLMIYFSCISNIGYCRPGDKVWTDTGYTYIQDGSHSVEALEFYRGKFYAVTDSGGFWEYDVIGKTNCNVHAFKRRLHIRNLERLDSRKSYLVSSADSLLLVIREHGTYMDYTSINFLVLEIDLEQEVCRNVTSLGTKAIFLGHSGSLSVDTIWYPELVTNSIYFTDDCYEDYVFESEGGGKFMGVYNLEDGNVQSYYSGVSVSLICPPVWTFITSR